MNLSRISNTLLLLSDKNCIRPLFKEHVECQGIALYTPLRSNMKDSRPNSFVRRAACARRLVEPVTGQLCERSEIKCNRACNMWHLVSRLCRKGAVYCCVFFLIVHSADLACTWMGLV
jgi:hypothetical protein